MTRRAGPATFVLCFALVPWGLEACGRGANVLEDDFGRSLGIDSGGAAGSSGGARDFPVGGGGGGGTVGGSPGKITEIGPGGGPPFAGGGPSTGDLHASRRRQLVEEVCSIPTRFPCLTLNVVGAPLTATPEDRRVLCVEYTISSQFELFGDRCFDEWQRYAECAVARADRCPCEGDGGSGCFLTPEVHDFGPGCEVTAGEMAKCVLATGGSGKESGLAGTYEWTDGEFGCSVSGTARNGVDRLESSCQGQVGGPQVCTCRVNGVPLVDQVRVLTGGDGPFYAQSCRSVAAQLAGGRCANVLDCCYQYVVGEETKCACGADPELAGYSSCGEMAAAVKGELVAYCDAYRPPSRR